MSRAFAAREKYRRQKQARRKLDTMQYPVTGEMRAAPSTIQERIGGYLNPAFEWLSGQAEELRNIPGIGDAVGWMVQDSVDPAADATRRAMEGEPNVFWDATSENPLNWKLNQGASDVALGLADVGGVGAAVPKLAKAGATGAVDAVGDALRRQGYSDPGLPVREDPATALAALAMPETQVSAALPSSDPRRIEEAIKRQEKWSELEKDSARAGIERTKTTGQYAGAPRGVTSPQKVAATTRQYERRMQDALDAGIDPGYFYEAGRKYIGETADDPSMFANILGPTSTQVGPYQNSEFAIRALDQTAMGNPVNAGLYPNELRSVLEETMSGVDPFKGYKVDRYSNLLGSKRHGMHQLEMMPPNDQWEGRGVGFTKIDPVKKVEKGVPPSSALQVGYVDRIRQRATNSINKKRVDEGKPPLTLEEAQALHWAAIRAEKEKRELKINPEDTIGGSIDQLMAQHSFEAAPGSMSGMSTSMTPNDYLREIMAIVGDDQGKDRFVRSMGGQLQKPMFEGTGVFEGQTAPGVQSRSPVGYTQNRGIDPSSKARLEATEATRQFMLGQDASAAHLFRPGEGTVAGTNAAQFGGGIPDEARAMEIQSVLDETLGKGNAITVPTEDGYRVLKVSEDLSGKDFKKGLADAGLGEPRFGKAETIYQEREAGPGGATKAFLEGVERPDAPGAARLAESEATRQIAGEMRDLYSRLESEGKLEGSHKLQTALDALSKSGLDGLRELVAKGLAPAVLLSLAATYEKQQQGAQSSVPSV